MTDSNPKIVSPINHALRFFGNDYLFFFFFYNSNRIINAKITNFWFQKKLIQLALLTIDDWMAGNKFLKVKIREWKQQKFKMRFLNICSQSLKMLFKSILKCNVIIEWLKIKNCQLL